VKRPGPLRAGQQGKCAVCSSTLVARAANQRTCSAQCGREHQLRSQRGRRGRSAYDRAREAILERDGRQCGYCGTCEGEATLCVDHIVPVADGGGSVPGNLITACESCNKAKHARRLAPQREAALRRQAEEASRDLVWSSAFTDALDLQLRYADYGAPQRRATVRRRAAIVLDPAGRE
jgi:5-methylcytosine-specific restriction endonuclease McrA